MPFAQVHGTTFYNEGRYGYSLVALIGGLLSPRGTRSRSSSDATKYPHPDTNVPFVGDSPFMGWLGRTILYWRAAQGRLFGSILEDTVIARRFSFGGGPILREQEVFEI